MNSETLKKMIFGMKYERAGMIDPLHITKLYGYSTFDKGLYLVRHQYAGRLFVRVTELGRVLFE